MRIAVAVGAQAEWNTGISWFVVRARSMALLAFHLRVQPGQRIASLRVIELLDLYRLPVFKVVALGAVWTESSLVLVLVTGDAIRRKSEEGFVLIFDSDRGTLRSGNFVCSVAPGTCQPGMLALKNISRLLVIKSLDVPFDQGKIFAVVIRVAADALLAGARLDVVSRMQPFVCIHTRGDFGMAFHTAERRLSRREFVASRAICGSAKRLMWTRQRSWRDLRVRQGSKAEENGRRQPDRIVPSLRVRRVAFQNRKCGFQLNRCL